MMSCIKKSFSSSDDAVSRCNEINNSIRKEKSQKNLLRPYKCDLCGNYHLTSMTKHTYKYYNDIDYRNKVKEDKFIAIETEYWEDRFGVR